MFYSNQQGRGQKGVRQSQLSGFLWRPIHEFILDQCSEEQQQQFRAASATGRGTAKQWLLVARPEFRSEIGNYVTNLCLVFNMKVPSLPPLHFFHPFIYPLLTHPHIVGIATDRPHSSLPSAVVMQFAGVRDKAHDECTIS